MTQDSAFHDSAFRDSDLRDPAFETFAEAYAAGRPSLLHLALVADLETPVAAFLKLRAVHAGAAFLLESVEGGVVRGRYSMIGLDPDLIWRCRDGLPEIARDAALAKLHARIVEEAPFVWVAHDVGPRAMSTKVKGVVQPKSWFIDLTPILVD